MSPREVTEKLQAERDQYAIKSQTVRHRPHNEMTKVNTFYQYKTKGLNQNSQQNDLLIKEEENYSLNKSMILKSPYEKKKYQSIDSKPSIKNTMSRK